jgi:hypothetical protein
MDPLTGFSIPSSKRLIVEYSIGNFETESVIMPVISIDFGSLSGDCDNAFKVKNRKQTVKIRLKNMVD